MTTINVNDFSSIDEAVAKVKKLAGSLGDQMPSDSMPSLYFPAGTHNKNGPLITISIGCTGFNITCDGFATNLYNIEINMDGAARCSIGSFMMSGPLGHGINSNSAGAFLSRQNSFDTIYIRDKTNGVIINGSSWNSWNNIWVEKSQGDGWQVLDTKGEHVSGSYSLSNLEKGLYMEKGGEFKTSGLSCHNNKGYGVHLYGTDNSTVVENYFEGLTSTIQQRTRKLTISNITNNSKGIQVNTTSYHELANDMKDINITGTEHYNGKHCVVSVIDDTSFILNADYVVEELSGEIDLPNWDLVIESDSKVNHRVNDQFFSGGNVNYAKIKGYNCRFDDMRIKQQFFVESPSNLIFRKGSMRGRQQSTFNDVKTSGVIDGVFESVLSDNSGSSGAGFAKQKFTAGHQELSVSPNGVNGSSFHSGNTGTMSDDTVFSFTPPTPKGTLKVTNGLGQNSRVIDITFDTVAGTTAIAGFQGAAIDRADGVLTGTTGTDTKITVSAANDGKIYLENRNGSQTLWWTIIR